MDGAALGLRRRRRGIREQEVGGEDLQPSLLVQDPAWCIVALSRIHGRGEEKGGSSTNLVESIPEGFIILQPS